jgi:hypothetical protein
MWGLKMRLLDKIALNRLISIITNFILGLIKIFAPKSVEDIEIPKPKRKKILPWRNKDE